MLIAISSEPMGLGIRLHVRHENGVLSLQCRKQPGCHQWHHVCKIAWENISVLSMCFLSCLWFNLNTQGFVYLNIVKYNQLRLHRNMRVLTKFNACISGIQWFYIQTCPGFLPVLKQIVYLCDEGEQKLSTRVRTNNFSYFALPLPKQHLYQIRVLLLQWSCSCHLKNSFFKI